LTLVNCEIAGLSNSKKIATARETPSIANADISRGHTGDAAERFAVARHWLAALAAELLRQTCITFEGDVPKREGVR
jgi:hypothetical protein